MSDVADAMREEGWSVAVHNDYRASGRPMTFWLWTHPSGRWIKGEGETDDIALAACFRAIPLPVAMPDPRDAALAQAREALRKIHIEHRSHITIGPFATEPYAHIKMNSDHWPVVDCWQIAIENALAAIDALKGTP